MARHQQKPKSFGAKLKSMFIGKGEQATFADAEKQTESGDASTDVSTDDEDDITAHPGARSQPFSVLGNLLALRDADHSGNSTAASSTVSLNSSIDENEGKSKLKHPKTTTEKDVHEKILNPEDGTSANPSASPSPQPGDSGRHTPRSAKHSPNKSAGNEKSLFSLKGHPAFLDKPTKYLSSAAHSALSTPGEVVSTVTKNFKGESSAAKKRRKEKKKDAIKAKLAAVIERQSFIMKLTRALMMFGSPSHRLEALITNTGTFLDGELPAFWS